MKVIIDRFEGEYAVIELEDGTTVDMLKSLVPKGAKEGDVLVIKINKRETEDRKRKIENLMNELWED